MANDPAEAFRTKVRVKPAAARAEADSSGPASAAPPRSLMEALRQAAVPNTAEVKASPATRPPPVPPETEPPSISRQARELIDAEPPRQSRTSRPVRSRVGRLAAAKLRQLQRLREAAAGLESLARGEIEEATVEIIHRDGSQPPARGRAFGLPYKR